MSLKRVSLPVTSCHFLHMLETPPSSLSTDVNQSGRRTAHLSPPPFLMGLQVLLTFFLDVMAQLFVFGLGQAIYISGS